MLELGASVETFQADIQPIGTVLKQQLFPGHPLGIGADSRPGGLRAGSPLESGGHPVVVRRTRSPLAYNRFLNRNTFQESFLATVVTLPPSNLAAELTDGTIALGFSYELAALMSSL